MYTCLCAHSCMCGYAHLCVCVHVCTHACVFAVSGPFAGKELHTTVTQFLRTWIHWRKSPRERPGRLWSPCACSFLPRECPRECKTLPLPRLPRDPVLTAHSVSSVPRTRFHAFLENTLSLLNSVTFPLGFHFLFSRGYKLCTSVGVSIVQGRQCCSPRDPP